MNQEIEGIYQKSINYLKNSIIFISSVEEKKKGSLVKFKLTADINMKEIKDEFEKLRVELNFAINETDALLDEKEKIGLTKDANKIKEKYELETKINNKLTDIKEKLEKIKTVLESQKRNKKKVKDTLI